MNYTSDMSITDYICDRFYYVVYGDGFGRKNIVDGLLLNYTNGDIILLGENGIYHIKYRDIYFMTPYKNYPLEKYSEEYQKLIREYFCNSIQFI